VLQTNICLDACVEGDVNGACTNPTGEQASAAATQVGWRGCTPGAGRQNWTLTVDNATGGAEVRLHIILAK
jgi:hypothetical protein